MTRRAPTPTLRQLAGACLAALCLADMAAAHAWSLTMTAASRRVFLHVGNGTLDATNGTVNLVQVTVPATAIGNGLAQGMTSNSTQANSLYGDNYATCPTPSTQLMIGASYRRSNASNGPASATLSVTSPPSLSNASGDTIPFTEISWTVSAPGSSVPNVIPAGTFSGGTQTLATVPANTYIENCHTYSYANSEVRAAGTYNGRVTYTLSSP
ncbi:hypothetical protein [Hydrogenophaga sp.]|uniref:hypothetical protein n=1 Tax=Hydrogenophaga sp. TaxID=1904254 RepID=UPI002611720A|nr:hypothetical protein [Hydrogenophaga sp.]MCW5654932.1 hypothetical protein [Hydrogenophaga sp.]